MNQLDIHNMQTFYRSFQNFKEDYFPKDIFLVIIEKSYIFWLEAVFILGWFAIKWIGYFSPEYSVFTKTKVFPTARRFYNISGKRMPEFLSVGSLQLGNFYKSKFISETAINMLDDRRIALFYLQGCTKRRKLLPYVLLETLINAKIPFLDKKYILREISLAEIKVLLNRKWRVIDVKNGVKMSHLHGNDLWMSVARICRPMRFLSGLSDCCWVDCGIGGSFI